MSPNKSQSNEHAHSTNKNEESGIMLKRAGFSVQNPLLIVDARGIIRQVTEQDRARMRAGVQSYASRWPLYASKLKKQD